MAATATKRPGENIGPDAAAKLPRVDASVAAKPQPASDVYIVNLPREQQQDVLCETLSGEYLKKGMNHERPVFKKRIRDPKPESVEVLLYYWDGRDGDAYEGWYLGNKLGGSKVWSHCKDQALAPPSTGWKIPWDGPVRKAMSVTTREEQRNIAVKAEIDALLEKSTKVEAEAQSIKQQAEASIPKSGANKQVLDALLDAERQLSAKVVVFAGLGRQMTTEQSKVSGPTLRSIRQQTKSFQAVHDRLSADFATMRKRRQEIEKELQQNEKSSADKDVLTQLQSAVASHVESATSLVEEVVMGMEVAEATKDDEDAFREAIKQVTVKWASASSAIRIVRSRLDATLQKIEGVTLGSGLLQEVLAGLSKKPLSSDMVTRYVQGVLQTLQDAQTKLEPLKNPRAVLMQKGLARTKGLSMDAKIQTADVLGQKAEAKVEEALSSASNLNEALKEARKTVVTFEEAIARVDEFVEVERGIWSIEKVGTPIMQELDTRTPRVDQAKEKMRTLFSRLTEASQRYTANAIISEGVDKMESANIAVANLEKSLHEASKETEYATLEGILKACDIFSSEAHAACTSTSTYMQTNTVDIKRSLGRFEAETLGKNKRQIDGLLAKMTKLKSDLATQRNKALLAHTTETVKRAEELAAEAKVQAGLCTSDAKLEFKTEPDVKGEVERMVAAERVASEAVIEARRLVTTRQVELRSLGGAAVAACADLQARLTATRTELSGLRRICGSLPQRLTLRNLVLESRAKLEDAKREVKRATEVLSSVENSGDEQSLEEKAQMDTEAKSCCQAASLATKTLVRQIEHHMHTQLTVKDVMKIMLETAKTAEANVDKVRERLRQRAEKSMVKDLTLEVEKQLLACKSSFQKAAEREVSASKDTTSLASIMDFEGVVKEVQTAIGNMKVFATMKRIAIKDVPAPQAEAALDALQKEAADAFRHLNVMRDSITRWKKELYRELPAEMFEPTR